MASVALDFTPPLEDNIVALRIYEAAAQDGSYVQIERLTNIGVYPDYISHYSTSLATSATDWFKIAWEDSAGVISDLSAAMQGGTHTLINKIVQRVLLRDPTLNENIVTQEAEWVIGTVKQTTDPYDVTLTATLDQVEGMTLLTLARAEIHSLTTSSSDESYTAGLVSQRSASGSNRLNIRETIQYLIDEANRLLGINYTLVMLLADIDPTGMCTTTSLGIDQSRLLLSLE